MSATDDRALFMTADLSLPLDLDDGIVVQVHDGPDGYLSAGEDEDPRDLDYVGVTVDDPATDTHEGLWSIGIPTHWSGHKVREDLWSHVVGDLLRAVRYERDRERAEAAEWAARDTVTV